MKKFKTIEELITYAEDEMLLIDLYNTIEEDFFYIERSMIDDLYTAESLLDDDTNLVDELKYNEYVWTTGSVYNSDFWQGGEYSNMIEFIEKQLIQYDDLDAMQQIIECIS